MNVHERPVVRGAPPDAQRIRRAKEPGRKRVPPEVARHTVFGDCSCRMQD